LLGYPLVSFQERSRDAALIATESKTDVMVVPEELRFAKISTLVVISSHPADRKLVCAGFYAGEGEFVEALTNPFKYVPLRQVTGNLKLADADTVSHYSHGFAAPLIL
jgi:hypothetical protein